MRINVAVKRRFDGKQKIASFEKAKHDAGQPNALGLLGSFFSIFFFFFFWNQFVRKLFACDWWKVL